MGNSERKFYQAGFGCQGYLSCGKIMTSMINNAGYLFMLLSSADFSKLNFSENPFRKSYNVDPDQVLIWVQLFATVSLDDKSHY